MVGETKGNRNRVGLFAAALLVVLAAGCTAQEASDFWNDPAWQGLHTMPSPLPYVWETPTPEPPEGVMPECSSNCL